MDPVTVGALSVGFIVVMVVMGVPIAVSLALVSMGGLWLIADNVMVPISMLGSAAFHGVFDYTYSVVPMFVLMGFLANLSGAAEDAYDFAATLLKGRRGGLATATVGANAIFAAVTGISVASAAMFSKVSLPPMLRHGYKKSFCLGTIAGSSILGMLIPPSVLLILYGIVARQSIGALFSAGVVPGILLALVYAVGIWVMVRLSPGLVSQPNAEALPGASPGGLSGSLWLKIIPVGALILLVLGGIYCGVFTPTEAGGVGAFGALVLALAKRRLNRKDLWQVMLSTGYVTVGILFILVTANMYARMITLSRLPAALCDWLAVLPLPPLAIIAILMVVLIALGAILDSTSIILITLPIMLPVVTALGFDPIWFGVVAIIAIETGLITPPFGLVVYTMKATVGDDVTVEEIFRGSAPFFIMMLLVLALVIIFPSLVLWLPGLKG
ncbi:MAG: TRAP transporter large permease subunit [Proteobacteria bacterium]|nr:TRAP transporter large permease subunit [Pseudomonadota bacterium]MBU1452433.1 TRAP transporter large permease subunit [Pseudomonadota bacterium]MBU2467700.1 TRAP transporter large permease subunit [Pseudomonadota bacterium]MBU2518252.1 TRAP transporter large permease subunit [Pseudomonadota bacterium]